MKASIWLGGDKFEIRDIPIPEIKEDEVLVKVQRVGLCGTDVHITQGLFPSIPPKILGHEFSGDIVNVGKNVDKSNLGKRAVIASSTILPIPLLSTTQTFQTASNSSTVGYFSI